MIVLTDEQAGKLLWKDQFGHALLRPIRLNDGRYALPESVLTQPEHARWREILNQGSIESAGSLTFDSISDEDYRLDVDGVEMNLYMGEATPRSFGYPAPSLFDIPNTGLYRFEAQYNSDLGSIDRSRNRRRVELLQYSPDGYQPGDTVWSSWSTIITDQRAGFDQGATTIFHQWHANPSSAHGAPILDFTLTGGVFYINSRSSASSGATQNRYMATAPAANEITNFVVSGLLGSSGHLTVWMNGAQIYDGAIPLGYYSESLPYMARLQYGIYMDNVHSADVLYHANIEFGTTDLSARVATPLPLPAPPEGWPIITHYPDTSLYPGTNLYPV